MFNSFYIVSIRRNFYARVVSSTLNPRFFPSSSFSSAASPTPKSISKTAKCNSFAVNYLINTFQFSPEKAFTASKYLKLESPEKPDSVAAFLKKHCFTQEQIGRFVRYYPPILLRNPHKALLPKIEFFQSMGFSETKVIDIILATPSMSSRNLETQIKPTFNYIKSLFDANGTSFSYFIHATEILGCSLQSRLLPNVEVLKEAGVPGSKIVYMFRRYPRTVNKETKMFMKTVEDVKQIGVNPSATSFIVALDILLTRSKSTWEKKVAVFKKWGVSEYEILEAFRRHPSCMATSVDKIMAAMDFFVNKMGLDSSYVLKAPTLISYSLDTRIKPRSSVYNKLVDHGLIEKGTKSVSSMYQCVETEFLNKYVHCYEEYAPGLLEMYQKELAISKNKDLQKAAQPRAVTI